jgi:protein-arginine kinase activator protein McsA
MNCSKCGKPSTVYDSRSGDNPHPHYRWLIEQAQKIIGWWTEADFRLRKRRCKSCGHKFTTIELELSDLGAALADVKDTTLEAVVNPLVGHDQSSAV